MSSELTGLDCHELTRRRREERKDAVIEVPFNSPQEEVSCPVCGDTWAVTFLMPESEPTFGNCSNWDCDSFLKYQHKDEAESPEDPHQTTLGDLGSGREIRTDGGTSSGGTELSTHLDESGLWIPPELREFTAQVVFRTPRSTIQHFQSGGGQLDPFYGLIDESHFGSSSDMEDPKNPELLPNLVSIKPQGEDAVTLEVHL